MPATTPPRLSRITYLQDTLFGVNALDCECLVQVGEPSHGGDLELLVSPPWPTRLQQAHGLTFDRDGQPCHGVVRRGRRLDNGQLLLVLGLIKA